MGGGDLPAAAEVVVGAGPELGLLAAAATRELGHRDHEGVVGVGDLDVGLHQPPGRRTAASGAEGGDLVVADEQAVGVAAQGRRGGREEPVEDLDVVAHQGLLVGAERLDEARRHRQGRPAHRASPAKSLFRMRACTPLTTSTTCEISKSVAAER